MELIKTLLNCESVDKADKILTEAALTTDDEERLRTLPKLIKIDPSTEIYVAKKGSPISNKLDKDTKLMASLISPNVYICSEPVYDCGYLIHDRSFTCRDIAPDLVIPLDVLAEAIELKDCFSKSKAPGSPLILRFENYGLAVLTESEGKQGSDRCSQRPSFRMLEQLAKHAS